MRDRWKGILLAWAMPLDWSHINKMTHISSMAMEKPNIVYMDTPQSGDIAEKREGQAEQAIKEGCTHIVMLDGDMAYYPTLLLDMFSELDKGADMVGGLCYRGDIPYDPLIWHPTEERKLLPFVDYQFGDVVDAGATGCACLLVKRQVFEGLKQPWFRLQKTTKISRRYSFIKKKKVIVKKEITIRRGEDTYFTRRATKAGFKLRILTKEDIGHMREFQVDRHFWLVFGILQKLGNWEVIAKLFKKVQDEKWVERELGKENLKGG